MPYWQHTMNKQLNFLNSGGKKAIKWSKQYIHSKKRKNMNFQDKIRNLSLIIAEPVTETNLDSLIIVRTFHSSKIS